MIIFFCGLVIIILRIAQFHIGIRTTSSPFETFLFNAAKPKTVETLFSYCLAGWLYAQAFRWSAPEEAGFSWITHYPGDRTRLNERALYLVVHVVCVGAVNAVLHLFWDSDRLLLRTARSVGGSGSGSVDAVSARGNKSQLYRALALRLPFLMLSACTRALVGLATSFIVYTFFLRPFAWRFTLALFRPFYSLPKSSLPPMVKPYFTTLNYLPRCFQAGFMFTLLVVISNAAFSIFLVNEPLKDGKPLTADSKDPNGSLLNGLKSKKDKIKAFSLWELAHIARDFPDRRVAIYTDIDRKDGSTWSQVCRLCLDVVKTLENRIDPPAAAAAPASTGTPTGIDDGYAPEIKRLTKPVRDDPILVATPQKRKSFSSEMEKMVNKVAVDPQSSPRLSPLTKQVLQDARKRLQDVQRDISGPENPNSSLQNSVRRVLSLPIVGWPFRLTFQNRITAAVLGGPYGEPSIYVNAINALSLLAVHSLQEDKFGNVQRDVATIIRELTRVTRKLDSFKASFPLHWTDVEARRVCPEVDDILDALKDGLTDLIASFGRYSRDLRLSQTDMRLAEEAATAGRRQETQEYDGRGGGPEMAEAR